MLPNISAQGVPVIDANGLPLVGDDCCCDGEFPCCEVQPPDHPSCPQSASFTITGVGPHPLLGCPEWCPVAVNGTFVMDAEDKRQCCFFERELTPHIFDCSQLFSGVDTYGCDFHDDIGCGNFWSNVYAQARVTPIEFLGVIRTSAALLFTLDVGGQILLSRSYGGSYDLPWENAPNCPAGAAGSSPVTTGGNDPIAGPCDVGGATIAISWSL